MAGLQGHISVAQGTFFDELAASGILERLEKRRNVKKYRLYRLTVAVAVTLVHILVLVLLIRTTIVTMSREKRKRNFYGFCCLVPPIRRGHKVCGGPRIWSNKPIRRYS